MTRPELLQALGQPDSVHAEPVENVHTGSIDTSIVWFYPQIRFDLQRAVQLERDVMISVRLHERVEGSSLPVTLGMPRQQVVERLGEGKADGEGTVRYNKTDADWIGDSVWIAYDEAGRVENIHWWYLP